ncbi:unnamed protein product [Angiostrongylus costaricensis]|uniref:Ovule protein n=1 Tax=Angiostrongylus costaricensis TaxID=334426 RepID=A0A0R3PFM1_ANGCS|nr:unnamed protein product [Angiostrongylus costaricensis]
MFVSSPLSFIENQCYDLLTSIADLTTVPDMDNHLQKVIISCCFILCSYLPHYFCFIGLQTL